MNHKRKLLFFYNPISGTGNKTALQKAITEKCIAENAWFEILETRADAEYYFLPAYIGENNITDVIVCGGDGTISQIIPFILIADINIGIIPMGSGNGLAHTAGIPPGISAALEVIFTGTAVWVDGLYINDRFSCMLCGLGFDAVVARDFADAPGRGLSTYITQSVKNWNSAQSYVFNIIIKDSDLRTEAFLVNCATGNQYGNHVTIAPKASLSDGLIDIVIVQKMSKMKLLLKFVQQVFAGTPQKISSQRKQTEEIIYYQASAVTILNPELAPLHIDGDPAATAKKFIIKCAPAAYKLLQP